MGMMLLEKGFTAYTIHVSFPISQGRVMMRQAVAGVVLGVVMGLVGWSMGAAVSMEGGQLGWWAGMLAAGSCSEEKACYNLRGLAGAGAQPCSVGDRVAWHVPICVA